MHYVKKRQRFENHNRTLSYDPLTKTSWSYGWYRISHKIEGVVLLNVFPYSKTTSRHIWKVARQLDQTNTKYIEVHAPNGIPTEDIEPVTTYMKNEIKRLQEKNNHRNAKGRAKEMRDNEIAWMQESLNKISSIIFEKEIESILVG
jgi:hypothetical protein